MPRLTAEQLARYRADYHQCGVTVMPLVAEIEALLRERDESREECARAWGVLRECGGDDIALHDRDLADAVRKVAGHFARLCREEADRLTRERDAARAEAARLCPIADLPAVDSLRAELAHAGERVAELEAEVTRLQRQVEGHCERIVKQSELLSRRAEKGSEALTAERDRLAVALREAVEKLDDLGYDVTAQRLRNALAAEGGG